MTSKNLHEIRSKIQGKVYWILPSATRKPQERQVVIEIANEFKDSIVDRPKEISADGIHPTFNGYKELAEKTK
jgi:lysophospholipase L1-like esterase